MLSHNPMRGENRKDRIQAALGGLGWNRSHRSNPATSQMLWMHDLPQVMPGVQRNDKRGRDPLETGWKRLEFWRIVPSRHGIQAPAAAPGMESDKCLQSTDKSPVSNCYI